MTLSPIELSQSFENLDQILSSQTRWTKEAGARNAAGEIVSPLSSSACCWCLIGGAWKAVETTDCAEKNDTHRGMLLCLRLILDERDVSLTVAEFNDNSGFDQVKELIGEAKLFSRAPFDVAAAEQSHRAIMRRRCTTA